MSERTVRPYTQEEDEFILSNWWDPARRKAVCEKLGRPVEGVNFRYYSLLRKMGKSPSVHKAERVLAEASQSPGEAAPSTPVSPEAPASPTAKGKEKGKQAPPGHESVQEGFEEQAVPDRRAGETIVVAGDVYDRVERIEKAMEIIHQEFTEHRKAFGRWLVGIGEAYQKGVTDLNLNELMARLEQLREENERLRLDLERKTEHYHETMRKLSFWLHQFMGLSSVQKIASLEDFIPRLRSVIDRYGVVTNAELEVPAFSESPPKPERKAQAMAS